MESIKSQLVDMGFSEKKINKAIVSCPEAKTLEQIMEWLIAHEGELGADDNSNTATSGESNSSTAGTSGTSNGTVNNENTGTKISDDSSQSDGFRPDESAVDAAARRKITVEEAQRLIIERQAIRAEEERKKAIEDEKKRRVDGQKMIQTRAELEDLERVRLAQQIRQEKIEKELHKKRVLEQIALDRANMKARAAGSVESTATKASVTPATSSDRTTSSAQPMIQSNECKIALRFPDGTTKVQKFSPKEQLAAVRLFVQMEKPSAPTANIEFIAPPNRKFTELMMSETLDSLGLCPASRLEVKMNSIQWEDLD